MGTADAYHVCILPDTLQGWSYSQIQKKNNVASITTKKIQCFLKAASKTLGNNMVRSNKLFQKRLSKNVRCNQESRNVMKNFHFAEKIHNKCQTEKRKRYSFFQYMR